MSTGYPSGAKLVVDPLVASVLTRAGAVEAVEPIDDDASPATLAVASPVPTNVDMLDLVNNQQILPGVFTSLLTREDARDAIKRLRRTAECTMRESAQIECSPHESKIAAKGLALN